MFKPHLKLNNVFLNFVQVVYEASCLSVIILAVLKFMLQIYVYST